MKKEHKCKDCAHLKKRETSFLNYEAYCSLLCAYVSKDCEPCYAFKDKKERKGK